MFPVGTEVMHIDHDVFTPVKHRAFVYGHSGVNYKLIVFSNYGHAYRKLLVPNYRVKQARQLDLSTYALFMSRGYQI